MRCLSTCGGKVKRRDHDPGYRSCRCGAIRLLTIEERARQYREANPDFGVIPTERIESSYKPRPKVIWVAEEVDATVSPTSAQADRADAEMSRAQLPD